MALAQDRPKSLFIEPRVSALETFIESHKIKCDKGHIACSGQPRDPALILDQEISSHQQGNDSEAESPKPRLPQPPRIKPGRKKLKAGKRNQIFHGQIVLQFVRSAGHYVFLKNRSEARRIAFG